MGAGLSPAERHRDDVYATPPTDDVRRKLIAGAMLPESIFECSPVLCLRRLNGILCFVRSLCRRSTSRGQRGVGHKVSAHEALTYPPFSASAGGTVYTYGGWVVIIGINTVR